MGAKRYKESYRFDDPDAEIQKCLSGERPECNNCMDMEHRTNGLYKYNKCTDRGNRTNLGER